MPGLSEALHVILLVSSGVAVKAPTVSACTFEMRARWFANFISWD